MAHSGQFVTADSFAEEADGPVAETSNVVSSLNKRFDWAG